MFGFLIGFVCLYVLARMVRRQSRIRRAIAMSLFSRDPNTIRYRLRPLFVRLQTTPEQESSMIQLIASLRESSGVLQKEAQQTRADISTLLRSDKIEAEDLGQLFARQDESFDSFQNATKQIFSKLYHLLEPRQRKILAEMIR